ncbi:hypothetical protein CYMTET_36860 [Cymbomonas tetramitiformis]|uniref:Vacuolar protein 8 n=1 Tax=Cymbomonas tetramitiformis TaxID=36881 RepID=A0AAE0F6U3_9CHLO|nr:hypothetical protein CYMTET_36860 [Cymbomonas tetramitiformis]
MMRVPCVQLAFALNVVVCVTVALTVERHAVSPKQDLPSQFDSLLHRLLGEGTLVGRENAAGVLRNLSLQSNYGTNFEEEGGLEPMCQLAIDQHSNMAGERATPQKNRLSAVGALMNLSKHDGLEAKIVKSGGLDSLVGFLKVGTIEGRTLAAGTIRNLSAQPRLAERIAKSGAIRSLVRCLSRCEDSELAEHAVVALGNLSAVPRLRRLILQNGAMLPLLSYIDSDGAEVGRINALKALGHLAWEPKYQQLMIDVGAVSTIKQQLTRRASAEIKEAAERTLACLSRGIPAVIRLTWAQG